MEASGAEINHGSMKCPESFVVREHGRVLSGSGSSGVIGSISHQGEYTSQ